MRRVALCIDFIQTGRLLQKSLCSAHSLSLRRSYYISLLPPQRVFTHAWRVCSARPTQMPSGADLGRKNPPPQCITATEWGWINGGELIHTHWCHCTRKNMTQAFSWDVPRGVRDAAASIAGLSAISAETACLFYGQFLSAQWTIVYAVLFVVVLRRNKSRSHAELINYATWPLALTQ